MGNEEKKDALEKHNNEMIIPAFDENSFALAKDMLEFFPVFVCIVDTATDKVQYLNLSARKLFGENSVGKTTSQIFEDSEFIAEPVDKTDSFRGKRVDYSASIQGEWFRISTVEMSGGDGKKAKLYVGIDITEIKKSEAQLLASVSTDSMTGIYNRQAGMDYLKRYVEDVESGNEIFTISYLDLNDLKFVNDTFGHSEGDEYILKVVEIINSSIRQTDIFARMGGDEFLIIFPKCSYHVVENIMETVESKLDVYNNTADKECPYSISYGILEINQEADTNIEHVLNNADNKMYIMKEEYRASKINP